MPVFTYELGAFPTEQGDGEGGEEEGGGWLWDGDGVGEAVPVEIHDVHFSGEGLAGEGIEAVFGREGVFLGFEGEGITGGDGIADDGEEEGVILRHQGIGGDSEVVADEKGDSTAR